MNQAKPIIQAAGVIDLQDAETIVSAGFHYIGFPLRLDYNTEDLSDKCARDIIISIKNKIEPILITYLNSAEEIAQLTNYLGVNIVQIHGDISFNNLKKLKELKPSLVVIKSLVVGKYTESELIEIANDLDLFVDYYITDTYNPVNGAQGATGLTHDWNISQRLVKMLKKPLILAGGMNCNNLKDAIECVHPFGVDSHTGIEDINGRKDFEKCKRFVEIAKKYLQ